MLFFDVLDRFVSHPVVIIAVVLGAAAVACQEPDPNYGDPNGIIGKKLPGEKSTDTSSSGAAPTAPALTTSLGTGHSSAAGKAGSAPAPAAAGKSECLQCHNGSGTPPKFAFGGRVETGGSGVADVVITVSGLGPVKSDADGYFWQTTGTVAAKATASAQKGDTASPMGLALEAGNAGGGCLAGGTCHGGSTGPIHP